MMPASLPRVMVDLFCGRGGWTKGFQAHGWHCIGIDLYPQPEYPSEFIQADIAHLYELPEADFYCCSSPCEQFSVHGLRCFFPNPKWPLVGLALFEHARRLLESTGKPFVMENVRAAQKFVGPASHHAGSFFLWGPGVPALLPQGFRKGVRLSTSGFTGEAQQAFRKGMTFPRDPITGKRELTGLRSVFSWEKEKRAAITAQIAEIPLPLASHIAQTAGAM